LAFRKWPLPGGILIVTAIFIFHQIGDEEKSRPEFQIINFKLITHRQNYKIKKNNLDISLKYVKPGLVIKVFSMATE
jgi:hypothetical protein